MTQTLCFLLPLVAFAIALDVFLVTGRQRLRKLNETNEKSKKRKMSRRELWLRAFFPAAYKKEWKNTFFNDPRFRQRLGIVLELTLLAVWAMLLGSAYLEVNPRMVPAGNEFGSAIQSHHLWTQVKDCGLCALWNGFERGGYPAFADIQGSMLHPLVAITTLIWGVVTGVKISLIIVLWSAGLAQWWLARELKLGWLPRMWSAGIAIAGGHLSGRMELGVFGVMLATAMGSLVFAGILHVENERSNRSAVLLGIVGALAILSGQGYLQVGLIGITPAVLILLVERERKLAPHWKYYLLASLLGLLLAAPLLIPLLHFGANIAKDTDPEFGAVQPLKYFVLNLVIDDPEFFRSNLLGKLPYPYLYSLYIGWIPIVLAIFGIHRIKRRQWRVFGFLITGIILAFLIAGAVILKPLVGIWPSIAGIRHSPQIAGLAVPLILTLSAYGLDQLLNYHWPDLFMASNRQGKKPNWMISLRWILLIPLLMSLKSAYDFSQLWLTTVHRDTSLYETLAVLKTDSLQWVEPPFGEHAFVEPAIGMGLKLSPGIMTWSWRGREYPTALRTLSREGSPEGDVELKGVIMELSIYENAAGEYATIQAGDTIYPCEAHGAGGFISVKCNAEEPGILTVREYAWSGWRVWVDGKSTELEFDETWLKVKSPAGKHTITLNYLPWDVPFGFLLFICGLGACTYLWRKENLFQPPA